VYKFTYSKVCAIANGYICSGTREQCSHVQNAAYVRFADARRIKESSGARDCEIIEELDNRVSDQAHIFGIICGSGVDKFV